ncbi:MAG: transcription elongation factor GreB [Lysobacterales bacterium]|jgi:transcription elongation factor GreB|nr:MAG: transcription elongation factor GreB [Xanthomonadales bacterium]
MARWRPPPPKGTALITREGYEALRRELEELWHRRRTEVVPALAAAAAEGDRSENAEYIYRKKQLAEIDRRIRYLDKRLAELRIVEAPPAEREVVFFGAWVTIEFEDGQTRRHRIVGPDETDARRGWISVDSPLARALLGRRVEEELEVELPSGRVRIVLVDVRYED